MSKCIDCGKEITSGNICLPCVRVRYPSKSGSRCVECGEEIHGLPEHEDYCNECFAKD